jgi:hypothetical protein
LSQFWSYPSSGPSQKKILARRVYLQQKKDPQKRKKKEQGSKEKEVKSHLPIQGHKKLHDKKNERMRIWRQVERSYEKKVKMEITFSL